MYISIILLQHSSKKTVHIVVHHVHNSVDSDKLFVRMDTPVVLIQKPYTFCEKKNVGCSIYLVRFLLSSFRILSAFTSAISGRILSRICGTLSPGFHFTTRNIIKAKSFIWSFIWSDCL